MHEEIDRKVENWRGENYEVQKKNNALIEIKQCIVSVASDALNGLRVCIV